MTLVQDPATRSADLNAVGRALQVADAMRATWAPRVGGSGARGRGTKMARSGNRSYS